VRDVLCGDENECCEVREFCVEVNSVCFMSEVRECYMKQKKCVGF